MNPKILVEKLNVQKNGQQVGRFSVKVGFEGGCEVILPGMRIVEGSKGTFVDVPSRKFKDAGFLPFYYLNKPLRDLISHEGLESYKKMVAEKQPEKTAVSAAVQKQAVVISASPASTPMVPVKTWPRKLWKPSYVKK